MRSSFPLFLSALLGGAAAPSDPLRLELSWELRHEQTTHTVRIDSASAGTLETVRIREYRPVVEPPQSFDATAIGGELASIFEDLRALPRHAHLSSSFAGVAVRLRASRGKESVEHDGFNTHYPAIERLSESLRKACGESAAEAFEPLLDLSRFRDASPWEYTPGKTPKERLLAPLDPPSPDVELRRLALRLAADAEAYEFVPKLLALFHRSKRNDPDGDYFLALALLRLGELEGADRVLAVAQSAHPEWAWEASGTLQACLGESFGKTVIPPYDFRSPGDPRPAAAETFRAWLREKRERLRFDRKEKRYLEEETAQERNASNSSRFSNRRFSR